jgi:hypothetical protein
MSALAVAFAAGVVVGFVLVRLLYTRWAYTRGYRAGFLEGAETAARDAEGWSFSP